MKIRLKNFRKHRDVTCTFPDQGLVLLTAPNGAGKSSIVAGIVYALYGKVFLKGRAKKPETHGVKSCEVQLWIKNLKVIRRSRPRQLLVTHEETQYEDEAAQGVIETSLGMTMEEFMLSSYIVQKGEVSVLSRTPTEQLKFLQQLVFAGEKVEEYRRELKERVQTLKEQKLVLQGEEETWRIQLENKRGEIEDAEDDASDYEPSEEIQARIQALQVQATHLASQHKKCEEELTLAREQEKLRDEVVRRRTAIERELESLAVEEEPIDPDLPDRITDLRKQLQVLEAVHQNQQEWETLQKSIREHEKAVQDRKEELQGLLLSDEDLVRLEEEEKQAEELQQAYDQAMARIQVAREAKEESRARLTLIFRRIKNEYPMACATTLKEMLKYCQKHQSKLQIQLEKLPKKTYQCPECQAYLALEGNELCVSHPRPEELDESEREEREVQLQKDIGFLEEALRDLHAEESFFSTPKIKLVEPPSSLEISKKLFEARKVRQEYERLSDHLPPHLAKTQTRLRKALKGARKVLGDLTPEDLPEALVELRTILSDAEHQAKLQEERQVRAQEQQAKKLQLIKALKRLQEPKVTSSVSQLEKRLSKMTQKMMEITIWAEQEKLQKCLRIEKVRHVQIEVQELEDQYEEVQGRLREVDEALEGTLGLEATIREAEILSLESTLENINEHARVHLEHLFPKETPVIRLENVRESKKSAKLQLHVSVFYRGETYDHIDEMSGAEHQKCDLAFMLAVNDILGSPLLILDESSNSIDPEDNVEVFLYLQEQCARRLFIVVSHEAVQGIFDERIGFKTNGKWGVI